MAKDWSLKGWTKATEGQSVTLAQALGITKGTFSAPQLSTIIPNPTTITQRQIGGTASSGKSGTASGGTSTHGPYPAGGTPAQNKALGKKMAAAAPYHWTGAQWTALNNIVMKESGWQTNATNPTSGAYGIPQALPASKMAAAGANWRTNAGTQIAWMLSYIRSRYGTPERAWAYHLAHGSY